MSWYTRGANSVTGQTTWSTGQVPAASDFNAPGLDVRTWGGNVDAGGNALVNAASVTLNPGTLPASPAAGMLAITAGNALQQYYSGAWHNVGAWAVSGSDIYYTAGRVSIGTASPTGLLTAVGGATGMVNYDFGNSATNTAGNGVMLRLNTYGGLVSSPQYSNYIGAVVTNLPGAGGTDTTFGAWNGSAILERMRITAAGSFGLGTPSPAGQFELLGPPAAITQVYLHSATGQPYYQYFGPGGSEYYFEVDGSGNLTSGCSGLTASVFNVYRAGSVANTLTLNAGKVCVGISSATVSGTGLLHHHGDTARIVDAANTPANSAAAGNDGEVRMDNSYVYVHTGGSWRRAAVSTF